jgi:hypothetical protein
MGFDFGTAGGLFGTGISDLFGAQASNQSAAGLDEAARREHVASKIAAASTSIQLAASQRQIEKAVGGQRSDVGSAGFKFSGTAIDLASDAHREGAIAQSIIEDQGAINVLGHENQAAMYTSEAQSARTTARGQQIGGFLSLALGVFSLFSDARLKHDIVRIGIGPDGKNLYEFSYLGGKKRFRGYIAQELDPSTVTDAVGFLSPDPEHRSEPV